MAVVDLQHVFKRYPQGHDALRDINLSLEAGEMAFLTGHSGAGKSTLLKLIALMERPSQGQMFVVGRNVTKIRRRQIPFLRRRVGMIFQDHRLLFDRDVYTNVALPLIIAGFRRQEVGRRVRAALDMVGLLDKERRYPITLSGGEAQRVGI
ncbi:MAG: cell division ATP-binding protein FtsE, partial [Thiohalospira sp.]